MSARSLSSAALRCLLFSLPLTLGACQCGLHPVEECQAPSCRPDDGGNGGGAQTGVGGVGGSSGGGTGAGGGFATNCPAGQRLCESACVSCVVGSLFCCPKKDAMETSGIGTFQALGVDRNDVVRFVVYDAIGRRLWVASGQPNSWGGSTADVQCGDCGRWVSLDIDPQNNLHLAYTDASSPQRVKYAYATPAGIQSIETIEGAIQQLGPTSIAVEDTGEVHVSYVADGAVRYARKTSSGWDVKTAVTSGRVVSIALFASTPSLAVASTTDVNYVVIDGGFQATTVAAGNVASSFGSSIAIDAEGNPVIAFVDPAHGDLRIASRDAGTWSTELVDPASTTGQVTLRLSKQGVPHLVFLGSIGQPRYAVRTDNGWRVLELDSRPASNVSLALDQAGDPHAMFYDPATQRLYYVR